MLSWLKTTVGTITAIGVIIAVVVIVWKWGTISDALQTRWFHKETVVANAHGDTAATELRLADTAHVRSAVTDSEFLGLANSTEVRANPIATRVAVAGKKAIANKNTEITHLQAAVGQQKAQVKALEDRGYLPTPRAQPYVDALYSFSNKRRPMINLRVGLDYRIFSHVSVKAEVGYMPPPTAAPKQVPEFVANVGGHFSFR